MNFLHTRDMFQQLQLNYHISLVFLYIIFKKWVNHTSSLIQPNETQMILDIEGQSGAEVFEAVQIEQSLFENVQLGAYVKYEQTQKSVDARVRDRRHQDRYSLSGDQDFVIRCLRYISHIIRLHQHRSSRVCQICQISRRVSKTRRDDEYGGRKDHHATSEHDRHSGNSRLLYHSVSFILCFHPKPILHDHIYDWFKIFREGCKSIGRTDASRCR